jgi:hypothetical protein
VMYLQKLNWMEMTHLKLNFSVLERLIFTSNATMNIFCWRATWMNHVSGNYYKYKNMYRQLKGYHAIIKYYFISYSLVSKCLNLWPYLSCALRCFIHLFFQSFYVLVILLEGRTDSILQKITIF